MKQSFSDLLKKSPPVLLQEYVDTKKEIVKTKAVSFITPTKNTNAVSLLKKKQARIATALRIARTTQNA